MYTAPDTWLVPGFSKGTSSLAYTQFRHTDTDFLSNRISSVCPQNKCSSLSCNLRRCSVLPGQRQIRLYQTLTFSCSLCRTNSGDMPVLGSSFTAGVPLCCTALAAMSFLIFSINFPCCLCTSWRITGRSTKKPDTTCLQPEHICHGKCNFTKYTINISYIGVYEFLLVSKTLLSGHSNETK